MSIKKNQKTYLKEQKCTLQQQQHNSRFLEAQLVWQADGKLNFFSLVPNCLLFIVLYYNLQQVERQSS